MKLKAYPTIIKEYLRTIITTWALEKNIPQKLAHLQDLANANKKTTSALTIGILSCLFISSILISLLYKQEDDFASSFNQIEDISPIINAKQSLEENKHRQVDDMKSLLIQGQQLKRELDSLLAIPSKNHHDSLELFRKHKQLELIVNYINEKD